MNSANSVTEKLPVVTKWRLRSLTADLRQVPVTSFPVHCHVLLTDLCGLRIRQSSVSCGGKVVPHPLHCQSENPPSSVHSFVNNVSRICAVRIQFQFLYALLAG